MQTFLPYNSYTKSAEALDNRRLGKQRVEVIQILNALRKPNYGWQNHPAVRMWDGYEYSLAQYGLSICAEWQNRGFKDTCYDKIITVAEELIRADPYPAIYPAWLSDGRLTLSHRSNLIRKDPDHYRPQWPDVPDDIPYYWPSHDALQRAHKAA